MISFSFTLLFLILAVAAVLAIIDAVIRMRGRGSSVLAIIQLIIAILLVLSWFVIVPFGQFALAVALAIVLVIQLVVRRGGWGLTIGALVLTVAFIVLERQWIIIPGING